VRELVLDGAGPDQQRVVRGAPPEQPVVADRHTAGVLHRAGVELRDEHLVVLTERVSQPEEAVVPVQPLPGEREDLLGPPVQRTLQRAARMDRQRDTVVLGAARDVRAGADRHEVRRERRRDRQHPRSRFGMRRRTVPDDGPVPRRRHRDGVRGLEVGLVETAEHPGGGGEERVPVEVGLAVRRVDCPVQALAVAAVGHRRAHNDLVVLGQVRQDHSAIGQGGRVE
jgi:hypothetical protein